MTLNREINLNTAVMVVGFLATFGGLVASYANLQSEQRNFDEFIEEQKGVNSRFDERFRSISEELREVPQIKDRVTQLQEGSKGADERINRVTESYSNQFSDIRAQLGSIDTQLALVKQSLDRIEAWRERPPMRSRVN